MKNYILAMLLFCSCAGVPVNGERLSNDTDCGNVGKIQVVLRDGIASFPALMTCEDARGIVSEAATRLNTKLGALNNNWTVIYTSGFPGIDENGADAKAATYVISHSIVVQVHHPYAVLHELFHAKLYEMGMQSDNHEGWCVRGLAALDSQFTSESVSYNCL